MGPKSSVGKKSKEESKSAVIPAKKIQTAEGWKRMMLRKQKAVKAKEQ